MKRILSCAVLLLCGIPFFAQPQVGIVRRPDKTIDFYLDAAGAPGTRTVLLDIASLTNCDSPAGEYPIVVSNDGAFLTLRPHNPRIEIGCDYTYRVVDAWLDAPVERSFVYRLPCTAARPVKVAVRRDDSQAGVSKDYCACYFACGEGDTLYAARRGVVTQVKQGGNTPANRDRECALRDTYLYVEHADGSIARYGMPESGRLAVGVGDVVFPDTPLAFAGAGSTSFSVALYRVALNKGKNAELYYVLSEYFDPLFATDRGNTRLRSGESYRPVVTQQLVRREMTEKEAKRHGRGRRR